MVTVRALDFNGETFEQRLGRMPDIMTRKHLISLRLFDNLDEINFAIKRGKIPAIVRGRDVHFDKKEIKKWLLTRDEI